MKNKRLFGVATVGTKGQIVIPAEARELLGIQPGDKLFVVGSESRRAIGLLPESSMQEYVDLMGQQVEEFNSLREQSKEEERNT